MVAAWAQQEAESVDLDDRRLDARFTLLLSDLGNRPNLSIPTACGGHAEIQAAYRFFDNDKVSFHKVLQPHIRQSLTRMGQEQTVLLVQDSSEIDLTRPQQEVAGAGRLDQAREGMLLHLLQGFTPQGTPLGAGWAQLINRTDDKAPETAAQRLKRLKHTPIADKESMRWIQGLQQSQAIAQQCPQTHFICVSDSEADIYEMFAQPRGDQSTPSVDWLVRACQDRTLDPQVHEQHHKILEALSDRPVLYEMQLLIRGREAKVEVDQRQRRQSRTTREASVQVRATTLTLQAPWRPEGKLPPVTLNVVWVHEPNPPQGEQPVGWILLSSLAIDTPEQVRQVVEYYCVRWNIEILFRVLKSGCRIEQRRFEQIDRVSRCLGLYLIVAWRTLFVCRMGREMPDADCELVFEPSEWKAVYSAVQGKKLPKKPPRLGQMVQWVAQLGGYIPRPQSHPGPQTMWIGLQRMYDLAWAWDAFGPETKRRKT